MALQLLVAAVIIIACVLFNKLSHRIGMPMLLAFIALGMFFGSDGIVKIPFEDYHLAEQICSVALIFIMFYGGFGTSWQEAKPVVPKALLLSSLGVVLTALLTGLFCHFVLGFELLESLLIGSVLGSTDAASVFSILRSKKLSLKYGTASLLEVESGSNDPCSYMLTAVILSVMNGGGDAFSVVSLVFSQIVFGAAFGFLIAVASLFFLRRFRFATDGFDAAFVLAVAVLSYALPAMLGGNGYLSAYIVGIILGNKEFRNRKALVHFFDGLTGLMQMLIFFLLGLLSFPSQIPSILLPSLAIALFLTLIGRPLAVALILTPLRSKFSQQLVVSWAGLRGAASIVFAIMATVDPAYMKNDIFHIAFCVVLFSIALQGSLLPLVAKKAGLIDRKGNVLKTFNDYAREEDVNFVKFKITEGHPWCEKRIREISHPPETLFVLILRDGANRIIPAGSTRVRAGDLLIMSAPAFVEGQGIALSERRIEPGDEHCGQPLSQLPVPKDTLIILIKRGEKSIIPNGKTVIHENDVLVLNTAQ